MSRGLGPRIGRSLCAGAAACAILAILAAPSSALMVMCTPNPDGTQICRGTDSFSYDGMNGAGCPSGAYLYETVTIEEEVSKDATNVTGTWGIDPTAICGGITDASNVPYQKGDALRGGAWKVDEHGNYVEKTPGKRIWVWTVRVKGKDPGGDHPQVVVDVTYDRPATSIGGGGGGTGGNTGGGSTGSTGSGVCDWSVSFDNPPKEATSVPVGYHLTVHNAGTGPCQGVLKLEPRGGGGTSLANLVAGVPGPYEDRETWFIRSLAPDGSDHFDVLANPKVANLGRSHNRISLRASLSPDADSPNGTDEFARVRTKLKPKPIDLAGGQTDSHGHGMLAVDCPRGKQKHDHCVFKLDIPATPLPQDRLLVPPLGSAQGTVPGLFEGKIDFGLPFTERKQLAQHHEMQVTFIGTRTEDGKSTLVQGRVTLKQ
jgi:hypothetical protein